MLKFNYPLFTVLIGLTLTVNSAFGQSDKAILLQKEWIYEQASFPECHASTIAETPQGLVAAWFGGTYERHPDVGIWTSSKTTSSWTPPVEVATGVQPDGKRLPCWNPVLFQVPNGELLLFYKIGPSPSTWWEMLKRSADGGKTWSALQKTALPNPNSGTDAVTLKDGRQVLVYNPTSPVAGKSGPRTPLNVAISDDGKTWKTLAVLEHEPGEYSYPAVIQTSDGRVHITYTWQRKRIRHVVLDPKS